MHAQLTLKIAIPLFGDRISPHFGASSTLLLVNVQEGKITDRRILDIGPQQPLELARRLVSLGAQQLICGGILYTHKQWLAANGVRVVDNQKGLAEALVTSMMLPGKLLKFITVREKMAGSK